MMFYLYPEPWGNDGTSRRAYFSAILPPTSNAGSRVSLWLVFEFGGVPSLRLT